jgi:hypothetical protein
MHGMGRKSREPHLAISPYVSGRSGRVIMHARGSGRQARSDRSTKIFILLQIIGRIRADGSTSPYIFILLQIVVDTIIIFCLQGLQCSVCNSHPWRACMHESIDQLYTSGLASLLLLSTCSCWCRRSDPCVNVALERPRVECTYEWQLRPREGSLQFPSCTCCCNKDMIWPLPPHLSNVKWSLFFYILGPLIRMLLHYMVDIYYN